MVESPQEACPYRVAVVSADMAKKTLQFKEKRRRTHCCLIMGMLTQLAAATATKGTQRATRGGAFCGKKQRKVIVNIIVIPVKSCAAVSGLKGHFQLLFLLLLVFVHQQQQDIYDRNQGKA